ncbi:MAG: amino acid ABC transporter permease [Proteobacteria bacterium]|nr:amino acid ABC transporter permease [Pseudomonadota bacterium]
MDAIVQNFFNLEILLATYPYLVRGLGMTILLCLAVVPLGLVVGLAAALLSTVPLRALRWALILYVDFFRSFPPLVLLVFVYYGLPLVGLDVPSFVAVAIAFTLNSSSYYGEIFRAGIESIPRGQWEAARSTGLGALQTMIHVIVPQATRNVLPDLTTNTLELIKGTSLASVVALPEMLSLARVAMGVTFNPTPLIAAAAIYLVLLWPLVRLLSRMERRMLVGRS